MSEQESGCVQPSRGPITADDGVEPAGPQRILNVEEPIVQARVGGMAPDFEAAAFVDGGFENIKLSDYRGHWVVLCFYPGDFTFV